MKLALNERDNGNHLGVFNRNEGIIKEIVGYDAVDN